LSDLEAVTKILGALSKLSCILGLSVSSRNTINRGDNNPPLAKIVGCIV